MSYDISLYLDVYSGGIWAPDVQTACVADLGNYTSNAARMWTDALGHSLGDLDQANAGDSLPALDAAVGKLLADPETYRAMEPSNGWGDYDGAVGYIAALRDACLVHPKAVIHISH